MAVKRISHLSAVEREGMGEDARGSDTSIEPLRWRPGEDRPDPSWDLLAARLPWARGDEITAVQSSSPISEPVPGSGGARVIVVVLLSTA